MKRALCSVFRSMPRFVCSSPASLRHAFSTSAATTTNTIQRRPSPVRGLASEPAGKITPEKKARLVQFLQQNQNQLPSAEQLFRLSTQIELSRRQVSTLLHHLRQPKGEITPQAKNFLRKWLQLHQNKSPTTLQRNQMQALLKWNRRQLNLQIDSLRDQLALEAQSSTSHGVPASKITQSHKDKVSLFLRTHANSYTQQQLHQLQEDTCLTKRQVLNLLRVCKESATPLTPQKKQKVAQWFRHNDSNLPSSTEEWALLERDTQLSRTQLYEQFRILRDNKVPITPQIKGAVECWVQLHQRMPTRTERVALLQQTQLSRLQLKSLLAQSRRKLQSATQKPKGQPK